MSVYTHMVNFRMQESPRTYARVAHDVAASRMSHDDEDMGQWEALVAQDGYAGRGGRQGNAEKGYEQRSRDVDASNGSDGTRTGRAQVTWKLGCLCACIVKGMRAACVHVL